MKRKSKISRIEKLIISVSIVLIVFCTFGTLIVMGFVSSASREVSNIEAEYTNLEYLNTQLQMEIDERLTFEEVDQFAKKNDLVLNVNQIVKIEMDQE